jgi:hypothetical protein
LRGVRVCADCRWGLVDASGSGSHWNATTAAGEFRPHYKLVVQGSVCEVKAGRENLFQCLVLFLVELRARNALGIEEMAGKVFRGTF